MSGVNREESLQGRHMGNEVGQKIFADPNQKAPSKQMKLEWGTVRIFYT